MTDRLTKLLTTFLISLATLTAQVSVSTHPAELDMIGDGIDLDSHGNIYIPSGSGDPFVWKITPDGTVSEFANGYESAVGIGIDSNDTLYVNDYRDNKLTRITSDGTKTDFAVDLDGPAGVAIDNQDNIYITLYGANFSGNGSTILRFTPDGEQSVYATGPELNGPIGIAIDDAGNIYSSNWAGGNIYKTTPGSGTFELFATLPRRPSINQITYADGYIYIPTPISNIVYRINMAGDIEILAGTGVAGSLDGDALTATFDRPNSVAANATADKIYIVDANADNLRVIDLGDGAGCAGPGFFSDTCVDSNGWTNNGPLGFVNVTSYPWVYILSFDEFAYVADASATDNGNWLYLLNELAP